ncbi:MAG: type II toxin-antitoxin system VapC family toxin [Candidatus Rokubacteria bacterium]|nr:type II toxin-antitoxin system VapC family toxin [Candidatus Rokubacteria bacterium]
MIYLDSSALIKKYVVEKGTPEVRGFFSRGELLWTSKVSQAEVWSAFARRRRARDLTAAQYRVIARSFERDWRSFAVVALSDEVMGMIRRLVERHPLRAFDAIQLASALWAKQNLGEQVVFVGADESLLKVAEATALTVANPEKGGEVNYRSI